MRNRRMRALTSQALEPALHGADIVAYLGAMDRIAALQVVAGNGAQLDPVRRLDDPITPHRNPARADARSCRLTNLRLYV